MSAGQQSEIPIPRDASGRFTGRTGGPRPTALSDIGGDDINTRNVPIDPAMLPKPALSHSDWIMANKDALLTGENPEHTKPLYNQDKNIFWLAWADYAAAHPIILQRAIYMYMQDKTAWIFQFFPINLDQRGIFQKNIITIDNVMPEIGTRKVPGRQIGFKIRRVQKGVAYTGQGFSMDYNHMKTEDGPALWNQMVAALTSNLWSIMIYMALMEFQMTPSWYDTPEKMYPYDAIPQTPEMVFDTERLMFGILNKTPQAVHLLSGMCARVFEQNQKSLSAWIATRGDIYFSNLMDETQIYYDKSGQIAERNRSTGDTLTTIADDLPVFSVPYLEATQQGGVEHNVLEHDRSVGSVFSFPDNTLHLRAGQYTSNMRDTKACSWTSNDRDLYKFDEFMRHAFEFFPVERDCGSHMEVDGNDGYNPDQGKLNRKLLMQLIHSRPYTHTETQKDGNERRLHTFLKYESRRGTWHPINAVGEIDEANCKDRYLHNVYKTMQYALEKNLSAEERQHLQAGMELAEELNRYRPSAAMLAAIEADAGAGVSRADGYNVNVRGANRFGGLYMTPELEDSLEGSDFWYGFGDLPGLLTLNDLFMRKPQLGRPSMVMTLRNFVPAYTKLVSNMIEVSSTSHAAFSPSLLPFHHKSREMTSFTASMIVAWYTLFSTFVVPTMYVRGTESVVVQLRMNPAVGAPTVPASRRRAAFNPFDAGLIPGLATTLASGVAGLGQAAAAGVGAAGQTLAAGLAAGVQAMVDIGTAILGGAAAVPAAAASAVTTPAAAAAGAPAAVGGAAETAVEGTAVTAADALRFVSDQAFAGLAALVGVAPTVPRRQTRSQTSAAPTPAGSEQSAMSIDAIAKANEAIRKILSTATNQDVPALTKRVEDTRKSVDEVKAGFEKQAETFVRDTPDALKLEATGIVDRGRKAIKTLDSFVKQVEDDLKKLIRAIEAANRFGATSYTTSSALANALKAAERYAKESVQARAAVDYNLKAVTAELKNVADIRAEMTVLLTDSGPTSTKSAKEVEEEYEDALDIADTNEMAIAGFFYRGAAALANVLSGQSQAVEQQVAAASSALNVLGNTSGNEPLAGAVESFVLARDAIVAGRVPADSFVRTMLKDILLDADKPVLDAPMAAYSFPSGGNGQEAQNVFVYLVKHLRDAKDMKDSTSQLAYISGGIRSLYHYVTIVSNIARSAIGSDINLWADYTRQIQSDPVVVPLAVRYLSDISYIIAALGSVRETWVALLGNNDLYRSDERNVRRINRASLFLQLILREFADTLGALGRMLDHKKGYVTTTVMTRNHLENFMLSLDNFVLHNDRRVLTKAAVASVIDKVMANWWRFNFRVLNRYSPASTWEAWKNNAFILQELFARDPLGPWDIFGSKESKYNAKLSIATLRVGDWQQDDTDQDYVNYKSEVDVILADKVGDYVYDSTSKHKMRKQREYVHLGDQFYNIDFKKIIVAKFAAAVGVNNTSLISANAKSITNEAVSALASMDKKIVGDSQSLKAGIANIAGVPITDSNLFVGKQGLFTQLEENDNKKPAVNTIVMGELVNLVAARIRRRGDDGMEVDGEVVGHGDIEYAINHSGLHELLEMLWSEEDTTEGLYDAAQQDVSGFLSTVNSWSLHLNAGRPFFGADNTRGYIRSLDATTQRGASIINAKLSATPFEAFNFERLVKAKLFNTQTWAGRDPAELLPLYAALTADIVFVASGNPSTVQHVRDAQTFSRVIDEIVSQPAFAEEAIIKHERKTQLAYNKLKGEFMSHSKLFKSVVIVLELHNAVVGSMPAIVRALEGHDQPDYVMFGDADGLNGTGAKLDPRRTTHSDFVPVRLSLYAVGGPNGSMYNVVRGEAGVEDFGQDESSIGGTLFSALPYVASNYRMMNRSGAYGGNLYRDEPSVRGMMAKVINANLYKEEAYNEAREMYRDIPDLAVHAMVYPLAGDPLARPDEEGAVSDLERRFRETASFPLLMQVAARLVLLTSITYQAMSRWYDHNIAIPIGGCVLRPWEKQTMFSQIATAERALGQMNFSGFDDIVSFDPMSQHFNVQASFHAGAIINDTQAFFFAKDTRGGAAKGGKGNRYINSKEDGGVVDMSYDNPWRERVFQALYDGEKLGNYSNIPVIQGYNTAVEFNSTPVHFDIRGNWQRIDFAGRLDVSTEFVATRTHIMYDGQFLTNYVLPLRKQTSDFDPRSMSHAQKCQITAMNNHVHQATQWVWDEIDPELRVKAFHPWGDEDAGLLDVQTSRTSIPITRGNIVSYSNK